MHPVNLETITSLTPEGLSALQDTFEFEIKPIEKPTLQRFISKIREKDTRVRLDGFFLDFSIPNIGKEFDLLKITSEFILNIELKSGNKTQKELLDQLLKNQFYISEIYDSAYYFTYYAESNTLYKLENDKLVEADANELIKYLSVPYDREANLQSIFSPEQFLVSPFNDTEKFLNHEYRFSSSQESQKSNITGDNRNAFIKGGPGTGKTLITYDIAHDYMDSDKEVIIFHGGNLNPGHNELIDAGFTIKPIKKFVSFLEDDTKMNSFDVIILDEVQRFKENAVQDLLNTFHGKVILSGDPAQTLDKQEFGEKLSDKEEYLSNFIKKNNLQSITLKNKFRSNKSIYEFIQGVINQYYVVDSSVINPRNISVSYFDNQLQALKYVGTLEKESHVLTLPSSIYNPELYTPFNKYDTSFNVIGQEFDAVTLIIGHNIAYGPKGKLMSTGTYYDSALSLVQNITRTRKYINLVIINNEIIFSRVMDILNNDLDQRKST